LDEHVKAVVAPNSNASGLNSKNYVCLQTLSGHQDDLYSLIVLKSGVLVSHGKDSNKFWDSSSGKCIMTLPCKGFRSPEELWSGLIVCWVSEDSVQILDPNNHTCMFTLSHESSTISSCIQLRNGWIASCGFDNSVKIWDSTNGRCIRTLSHSECVYSCIELSNGQLASCDWDSHVKLWDVISGNCVMTLTTSGKNVYDCVELKNGLLLSSAGIIATKITQIWNVSTGKCVFTLSDGTNEVKFECELRNGYIVTRIKYADSTYSIKVWNISNSVSICLLTIYDCYSFSVKELSNGLLAVSLKSGSIQLWDVSSCQCVSTLAGHKGSTSYVCEELKNGIIVSNGGEDDHTIKLWDPSSMMCIATLNGHNDLVRGLKELSDGRLVTWSNDKTIKIWG
jgi:WD40 repeat protein